MAQDAKVGSSFSSLNDRPRLLTEPDVLRARIRSLGESILDIIHTAVHNADSLNASSGRPTAEPRHPLSHTSSNDSGAPHRRVDPAKSGLGVVRKTTQSKKPSEASNSGAKRPIASVVAKHRASPSPNTTLHVNKPSSDAAGEPISAGDVASPVPDAAAYPVGNVGMSAPVQKPETDAAQWLQENREAWLATAMRGEMDAPLYDRSHAVMVAAIDPAAEMSGSTRGVADKRPTIPFNELRTMSMSVVEERGMTAGEINSLVDAPRRTSEMPSEQYYEIIYVHWRKQMNEAKVSTTKGTNAVFPSTIVGGEEVKPCIITHGAKSFSLSDRGEHPVSCRRVLYSEGVLPTKEDTGRAAPETGEDSLPQSVVNPSAGERSAATPFSMNMETPTPHNGVVETVNVCIPNVRERLNKSWRVAPERNEIIILHRGASDRGEGHTVGGAPSADTLDRMNSHRKESVAAHQHSGPALIQKGKAVATSADQVYRRCSDVPIRAPAHDRCGLPLADVPASIASSASLSSSQSSIEPPFVAAAHTVSGGRQQNGRSESVGAGAWPVAEGGLCTFALTNLEIVVASTYGKSLCTA